VTKFLESNWSLMIRHDERHPSPLKGKTGKVVWENNLSTASVRNSPFATSGLYVHECQLTGWRGAWRIGCIRRQRPKWRPHHAQMKTLKVLELFNIWSTNTNQCNCLSRLSFIITLSLVCLRASAERGLCLLRVCLRRLCTQDNQFAAPLPAPHPWQASVYGRKTS